MLKIVFVFMFSVFFWSKESMAKNPVVEIKTSKGLIVLELDEKKSPKTVENFLMYAKDKFYDNTIFHRVIDGFMIQGGGFNEDMSEKESKKPIKNEAGKSKLKNEKYTIAMARTSDPHSATAQFFINVKDNPALDFKGETAGGFGYAVFGKVTKGTDVVDTIKSVKTGTKNNPSGMPFDDVPVETVKIESIRLKK